MKQIQLGGHNKVKGEYRIRGYALVDDEDFDWLNQWSWILSNEGYAVKLDNKKCILMHRLINKTPKGFDTDHLNRNKLDNRRSNLRTATRSQNNLNMGTPRHNTSGHKGVTWNKRRQLWQAQIQINNKCFVLLFSNKMKAVEARRKMETTHAI